MKGIPKHLFIIRQTMYVNNTIKIDIVKEKQNDTG